MSSQLKTICSTLVPPSQRFPTNGHTRFSVTLTTNSNAVNFPLYINTQTPNCSLLLSVKNLLSLFSFRNVKPGPALCPRLSPFVTFRIPTRYIAGIDFSAPYLPPCLFSHLFSLLILHPNPTKGGKRFTYSNTFWRYRKSKQTHLYSEELSQGKN